MKTIALLALLALSCGASSQPRCPRHEVLQPCACAQACASCAPVIRCSALKGEDQLDQLFQRTGDYPFTDLQLVGIEARYIPSARLEEKQVRRLSVVNSTLTTVFEKSPSATSPLEVLYLSNVRLVRGIEPTLLEEAYHLRRLFLVETDVRRLSEDLRLPAGLQVLELVGTRTRALAENALASLKNLRSLTVRRTRVSALARNALPSPFKALFLDLSENRLSSLPDDFFTDMPDLQTVILSRNELTSLPPSVFGHLPARLRVIFLRGNPVKCDCKVSWITSKRMPYLEGKCAEPKPLKDKPIRNLAESDFIQC